MNPPTSVPDSSPDSADATRHDPDALVSEQSAAEFLSVTPGALQKWRMTGNGPQFVRISSRCVRYQRRDLVEWARARVKSSTAE